MAGELIVGSNAVLEALRVGGMVNRVYLARDSRAARSQVVVDAARSAGVPFDFVPVAKLNALTGTGDHQGVAASVSPVGYVGLEACLEQCGTRASLVVLDGVEHPKNLGMIVRTASGAGASGVILPKRGSALVDGSVVRASAGAVFRVPLARVGNLGQALGVLKEAGFWIYGLEAGARESVFGFSFPDRVAFVLGNETRGLREGVRKACDDFLSIPLVNEQDSLNVAVAAGIALFQYSAGRG